jgi:Ran GTPase-activating protein (RanGAP) involved in mRNA processing and transport
MRKANTTVINLDLNDNSFGDMGAALLADVVKTNATLSGLRMRNRNIGHTECLASGTRSKATPS